LGTLTNVLFSYSLLEKRFLGLRGVVVIVRIMVCVINVYVRLVFRLRLELVSFKIRIYGLIIILFLLAILSNLSYKFNTYEKVKNFKEVWCLNVYSLDQFVYWNIRLYLEYSRWLRNVKLFLLINWWVMVVVVVIF